MSTPSFTHYPLNLINPSFQSSLVDLVTDLDYLRKKQLYGTTQPYIFFQLKDLFHMLESIGSARIEGNNTTIAEYIETKLESPEQEPPSIIEIHNIEKAMDFIEDTVSSHPIDRAFVSELHKIIVKDLPTTNGGEGDKTPGEYRKINLAISKSSHIPPDHYLVDGYMDELFKFIAQKDAPKYDLLKAAIAHHRFVWIHPFGNGNGRTVRLFTYAMLVKLGFNVADGRLINPTAVFCNNREQYYYNLSLADAGSEEGLEQWCTYVLSGLKEEIEKIDHLLDYNFLRSKILVPAINHAHERQVITDIETKILKRAAELQLIQAKDIKNIFDGKHSSEISRQISKLIEKKMLSSHPNYPRKYMMNFANSYLLRSVIKTLGENGFLPDKIDE